MYISEIDIKVFHAVRAAKLERTIGARMARLYARNKDCITLYLIARSLERGNI